MMYGGEWKEEMTPQPTLNRTNGQFPHGDQIRLNSMFPEVLLPFKPKKDVTYAL